jgi:hypothetical protein
MSRIARKNLGVAVAAISVIAVVLAAGARPAVAPQLLTVDSITIANGTAALSGSVGGGSAANTQLSVNGRPLSVDATGGFGAVVNLDGASALLLTLVTPATAQRVGFEIPLTSALIGPGGVISGSVLDAVEQAGAKLLEPVGGFQALAGQPLLVRGVVLDRDQLAGLALNGKDVTPLLGSGQTFTTQLPGTTKELVLTAKDSQGTTQTSYYRVLEPSTPLTAEGARTVTAGEALGIRIAKVRYLVKGVPRTKRLRMLVTVKDRRGYLIRGAKITVRSKGPGRLKRRTQAKLSARTGQATFTLRVRPATLGKRLFMVTVGRTPTAKASKVTSVRVAKARRRVHH